MQLSQLCTKYGIPHEVTNWDQYRRIVSNNDLLEVSTGLYRNSGNDTIVIGGHVVLPELLGLRNMRRPSGDIDSVASEQGIRLLFNTTDLYGNVHYGSKECELFLELNGIPIGVSLDRIHDWVVTDDFRESSIEIETEQGEVRVASPEYQVMLKLRRGYHCIEIDRPFYGKDRIDIASMFLAHLGGRMKIDIEKLKELILEHVTHNRGSLSQLWSTADLYNVGSLRKNEKKILEKLLYQFSSILLGS